MKYLAAILSVVLVLFTYQCSNNAQEIPQLDWDALQETKPWEATEVWEPVPKKVTPAGKNTAPSDAIVLFDGTDLSNFHKCQFGEGANMEIIEATIKNMNPNWEGAPIEWTLENGEMVVKPGTGPIETKQKFQDYQLHLEWLSPVDEGKEGQAYSNSGLFLNTFYEIQILNSYDNKTYPNGQAGALYKQAIPLVNPTNPPGEWQTYDIIFTAPRFKEDGSLESPARITALLNGVLIQNNVELTGPTAYIGEPKYVAHPDKLPIRLQDHGDLVRFRNMWVREL